MRYKYVSTRATVNIPEIMEQYNVPLEVLIQLNKFRYPHMIDNPFMTPEGSLLMVPITMSDTPIAYDRKEGGK